MQNAHQPSHEAEAAAEEADRLRKAEPAPAMTRQAFLDWRSPRSVSASPTRLDNPLWHWLVRTRHSAYSANRQFAGPSSFDEGPMWCFDRFGQSETTLPDGRVVFVAGEHEDGYDPDFFIYNDVVVVAPDGTVSIHGYAPADFPPTDFHSATRVGEHIYLVGCLGHPAQREIGRTPVFRLSLDDMAITRVETRGDAPGWIREHSAELSNDGKALVVRGGSIWRGETLSDLENIDAWSLCLVSGQWTRLTALDWQRWTMIRVDRKPNRLSEARQELWRRKHGWPGLESHWQHDDEPDAEALAALYRRPGEPLPEQGDDEYNVHRLAIDGVVVRFTEERWLVRALVEGRLAQPRLRQLQDDTMALLQRIDASAWEIEAG